MHETKVYEYAVIRLVPKVEREEFFNVGLIMFSKRGRYIRAEYAICPEKFRSMPCEIDLDVVVRTLENFVQMADGDRNAGPIASLDIPERFRWLTAVRSSVIQTSRPHPGRSDDLDGAFQRLFDELVR